MHLTLTIRHDHHLNTSDGLSADEVARLPPRRGRPVKTVMEIVACLIT